MAFLEISDFCSVEEYTRNRSLRIREGELETGGLYTYAMRLDHAERQAAKQAVRVERVVPKTGFVVVRFAFLDADLDTSYVTHENMNDGIIHGADDEMYMDYIKGVEYRVEEAYLRDYFEDQFGRVLDESSRLTATV